MTMTLSGDGTIGGLAAGGLPDESITQAEIATNVVGTGPAFSAYTTGSTSVSNTTFTKVIYGTEEFDTNSNYDTSISRFTPTIAGYYQVNAALNYTSASLGGNNSLIMIYKNGSWFKSGSGGNVPYYNVAALVYMNGSTDYLEIYAYQSSGASRTIQNGIEYQFSAAMVRRA